jgi:hypothetical protein
MAAFSPNQARVAAPVMTSVGAVTALASAGPNDQAARAGISWAKK